MVVHGVFGPFWSHAKHRPRARRVPPRRRLQRRRRCDPRDRQDGREGPSGELRPGAGALLLGGGSSTRVVTYTALVAGDVINHSDDNDPSGEHGVGTYNITVPDLANATNFRSVVGSCRTSWNGNRTADLNLYTECVQASNTVIGTAFDDGGAVIGVSFLGGNATPGARPLRSTLAPGSSRNRSA